MNPSERARNPLSPAAAAARVEDAGLAPYRLLEGVVAASRALLEAADFTHGLSQWISRLATAVSADMASYCLTASELDQQSLKGTAPLLWCSGGVTPPVEPTATETEDFARWLRRLSSGEIVWASVTDLRDSATVNIWNLLGCKHVLLVPVVVDGRTFSWLGLAWLTAQEWQLGFDIAFRAAADGAAAAIKRAEAERQACAEREARVAVERARAEQAEADARGLRAREQLIQAVTESARRLLGTDDFDVAVTAALAALGAALSPERVALVQDIPTADDQEPGRWVLTHEWYRPDSWAQIGSALESGPYPSRQWWEIVKRAEPVVLSADFEENPDDLQKILTTPVPGSIRRWLTVGFDRKSKTDWSAAELAVLQTAAACLGAAIARRDVEAERLREERRRTKEAKALTRLLEGVVAASRALIESSVFEIGMEHWLEHLAQAIDADRAMYGKLSRPSQKPDFPGTILWARRGNLNPSMSETPVTADIERWAERLRRGEAVWIQQAEVTDPQTVECWKASGAQTVLLIPVFLDGCGEAFLAFDWEEPQEWVPAYGSVLRTAADGAAAAIKRNEAVGALVAEREKSANERTAELAKANAGMRRTLASLAASQNIDEFLSTALMELHRNAGGVEAYLFVKDADDDRSMKLRASIRGDAFQVQSGEDDPPTFASGFEPMARPHAELLATGRMIWREIEPTPESRYRPDSVQRWHLRKGHRGEARYLLQVGDRTVGMVAMTFNHAEALSEGQAELLVALSQPIALALELSRLAEVANLAAKEHAVLAERNRMARDVHDTLAQGFTAISLQLQAAALASDGQERDRFVARAALEAQNNLAESRRTIRILRGIGSAGRANSGLADVLEDALSSRLDGSPIRWRVVPLQPDAIEPVLGDDVRRELSRIAQEAATNALKHAQAKTFEARLHLALGKIVFQFVDDGRGFETGVSQDGFGLIGMRERAERIGAVIEFRSRPGGPTTVSLSVALDATGAGS